MPSPPTLNLIGGPAMFIYYVYAYLREDGTPYYIGKGKNKRAFSKDHSCEIPSDKSKIVFLERNLSEIGAFALERKYIAWYDRSNLLNKTDGGDGTTGATFSLESRQRMSKMRKGIPKKPFSEETRLKMRLAKLGKKQSEKHKENLSKVRKGRTLSEEHKAKIKAAFASKK